MEQNRIERVSIALKPNVYNTFRNLVNTVSNTLGEYVDNAVQSFLDSKDQIATVEPGGSPHNVSNVLREFAIVWMLNVCSSAPGTP